MEIFDSIVSIFRALGEILLAAARFDFLIGTAAEQMCDSSAFLCGIYGFWIIVRNFLIIFGLILWKRLAKTRPQMIM